MTVKETQEDPLWQLIVHSREAEAAPLVVSASLSLKMREAFEKSWWRVNQFSTVRAHWDNGDTPEEILRSAMLALGTGPIPESEFESAVEHLKEAQELAERPYGKAAAGFHVLLALESFHPDPVADYLRRVYKRT